MAHCSLLQWPRACLMHYVHRHLNRVDSGATFCEPKLVTSNPSNFL